MRWFLIRMLTYLIDFTPFQIGSRYIVRRLVQKVYDMALAIGLRGYAQTYVAEFFQILYKENLNQQLIIYF